MNPIDIGSRRELFVDPYLVDTLTDAQLHLHEPVRRETVFRVQEPLENACTGCFNLVQADGKILVYYRGYHPTGKHEDLPDGWGGNADGEPVGQRRWNPLRTAQPRPGWM